MEGNKVCFLKRKCFFRGFRNRYLNEVKYLEWLNVLPISMKVLERNKNHNNPLKKLEITAAMEEGQDKSLGSEGFFFAMPNPGLCGWMWTQYDSGSFQRRLKLVSLSDLPRGSSYCRGSKGGFGVKTCHMGWQGPYAAMFQRVLCGDTDHLRTMFFILACLS